MALAIFGFHQGFGFVFTTQGVEHLKSNPLGLDFGGNWWTGAALVAVLANVYIFYGFESAGDISEETLDAQRQVPRAMRSALLYGGIASFVLVLGLLLATPTAGIGGVVGGGVNAILADAARLAAGFLLGDGRRGVFQLRHRRPRSRCARRVRPRARRRAPAEPIRSAPSRRATARPVTRSSSEPSFRSSSCCSC